MSAITSINLNKCYSLTEFARKFGRKPSDLFVVIYRKEGLLDPYIRVHSYHGGRFIEVVRDIPDYIAQEFYPVRKAKPACDVCGSTDVVEAPHMGMNCNRCHPL